MEEWKEKLIKNLEAAKKSLEEARKAIEVGKKAGIDMSEQERRYNELKARVEALEKALAG